MGNSDGMERSCVNGEEDQSDEGHSEVHLALGVHLINPRYTTESAVPWERMTMCHKMIQNGGAGLRHACT